MTEPIVRPRRTYADLSREPELNAEEIEADRVVYACFMTPEGKELLALMHRLSTFFRNRPSDPDGALRWLEAQRTFVANLEVRAKRHQSRAASATKEANVERGQQGRRSRRGSNPA